MPEDTKKNAQKGKNEAKEQRKRRQGRQHAAAEKKAEKAPEKKIETAPQVPKEPEKPTYEPPGPEFYNSLKRETDEILKITEEENSKYKKKEIQSNWAKYEMPIESYDEIEEQESLGADYETLIQASFTVGGHFQFKHEKSWDVTTGPTPYDKYFEINMESLNLALSTIPFYERSDFDKSVFTEGDIKNMDHKSAIFKQKYFNDKKYTTPDLEAQEKILNSLMSTDKENNGRYEKQNDIKLYDDESDKTGIDEETIEFNEIKDKPEHHHQTSPTKESPKHSIEIINKDYDTLENQNKICLTPELNEQKVTENKRGDDLNDLMQNEAKSLIIPNHGNDVKEIELPKAPKEYPVSQPKESPKNPIIESPEDLEKWLDDFLDG